MAAAIETILKSQFYVFLISLGVTLGMAAAGYRAEVGPPAILTFASLALYLMGHPWLKNIAFTIWVFTFVTAAMFYPGAFMAWSFGIWFGRNLTLDLGILIVPLIQIIMFGMGTTLSMKDFTRVAAMPWPVLIGMVLQFSVMPFAGLTIAVAFGFEPEVAAGVVLIGSCPGGVASNLMTYLARGNVALSVTMTACSTLVSPLMTPWLMDKLAGRFIEIDFFVMMIAILNMVIVPIVAGLIANKILYGRARWVNRSGPLGLIAAVCILAAVLIAVFVPMLVQMKSGLIIGFALVGVVAAAKLFVSVLLAGPQRWMDKTLPIISMAGICFIIAIITARSQEKLLTVGLALIGAAILHNFIGYILGYWCAKAARLGETSCRTVAIEVGLQNGGMASGLAMNVLQSAQAALAPAIFGPWMNISGSMLASWWARKPAGDRMSAASTPEPVPDSVT